MTIPVIIYVIGVIIGYLSFKKYVTGGGTGSWTVGMRIQGIFASIFASWLVVIVCYLLIWSDKAGDKKATW